MQGMKSMKWRDANRKNPLMDNESLFSAALDEFSQKTFKEASLNDILKKVGMNKGSFYYRFYDKADLYLSLVHRIGIEKIAVINEYFSDEAFPSDFFDRIKAMARISLMYARKDKRYYLFWKKCLNEGPDIHELIMKNLSGMTTNTLADLVSAARKAGQFNTAFSDEFVLSVIELLINNAGHIISPDMSDEEILSKVDELSEFLKNGFGAKHCDC